MTDVSIHRIRNMHICDDGVGAQRSAEGPGEHGDAPHRGCAMAVGYDSACGISQKSVDDTEASCCAIESLHRHRTIGDGVW